MRVPYAASFFCVSFRFKCRALRYHFLACRHVINVFYLSDSIQNKLSINKKIIWCKIRYNRHNETRLSKKVFRLID